MAHALKRGAAPPPATTNRDRPNPPGRAPLRARADARAANISAECSSRDHSRSTPDGWTDGLAGSSPRPGRPERRAASLPLIESMHASPCFRGGQTRNANTGPGNLVAPVNGNQDRGQRLGRNRIGEASAIDAAGGDDPRKRDDLFANVNIIREHQHVAIDFFTAVELLSANVVERRGDTHLRTKDA